MVNWTKGKPPTSGYYLAYRRNAIVKVTTAFYTVTFDEWCRENAILRDVTHWASPSCLNHPED